MITELTNDQIARFPEYIKKWLEIGLCTDRVDWRIGKEISDYYYKNIALKPTVPVVVMSSPLYAWYAVCLLSQVRNQIENQVWNQVRNQVWSQVESQVRNQLENQVESQVLNFIYPWLNGHFMSSYFSFFNFMNEVLNIKYDVQEKYEWYQKTSHVGLIYPLENICIISDRPESIKMKNGLLHCEGSAAIKYIDNFSIWALNGISVTKEIAETPAEKLDAKLILNEQNTDIQREILKKIGAERALKKLNAECLDKWTDPKTGKYYELLRLKANNINRKYLYYEHASLKGYFYAKPVPPEINKALQARAWIIGCIERNELNEISDIEIEALLPSHLS
jgi:hypothetical protein